MVIVDSTGIHSLPVVFCGCQNASRWDIQLLDLGLFPGSVRDPQTAFTFQVLDDFALNNLVCKTAILSFHTKLKRMTNMAFPSEVPDHYLPLLGVTQQWQNLRYRKWAGVLYGHDQPLCPRALALFCPACPQPGINIPMNWKEEPREWLYMRSFVMDGCFRPEHLKMTNPWDDISLEDGSQYMVALGPHKDHLQIVIDHKPKSTCHNHKAVSQANADRHDLDATGIGATVCARDGCFAPHSAVNFQKGERYDPLHAFDCSWLMSAILMTLGMLCLIMVLYDVMCQYHVNLKKRISESHHLASAWPSGITMQKGTGLFHVHGHQNSCTPRFSLDYIVGASMIDGEIVETTWRPLDKIAGCTRTMTTSHREETLNDHMGYWNFMKCVNMTSSICRKLKAACLGVESSHEAFEELDGRIDDELRKVWIEQEQEVYARRLEDPSAMDIFNVSSPKGTLFSMA
ncbi:hypothetical protein JAAARDRAFT_142944 [Jaapia argillacea MUCL 33604]|uniref:CxC2-like cysteine cluster KDZ transposase-associated domain-containing protein n=1 Tax=Jaapia argillacea MUCL 33604 TaxID=933084 RepID=A0A067PFJ5_9AGAM|nr:hypothetical protein JAAARDRAFT_142944 [Jaapia argillacea MUCL 33604]